MKTLLCLMKVLYSRYLPPFISLDNPNCFLSVLLSSVATAPSERFFCAHVDSCAHTVVSTCLARHRRILRMWYRVLCSSVKAINSARSTQ